MRQIAENENGDEETLNDAYDGGDGAPVKSVFDASLIRFQEIGPETAAPIQLPASIVYYEAIHGNDFDPCAFSTKKKVMLGRHVHGYGCDEVRRQYLDGVPSSRDSVE